MKIWKHYTFIGILVILVFVLVFGCSATNNGLSGTWEYVDSPVGMNYNNGKDSLYIWKIAFSGKKFTITGLILIGRSAENRVETEEKGTYSISDNKIELVFSNGQIEVFSFSRTENTLSINGRRYNSIR